jgi:hypothetical protein
MQNGEYHPKIFCFSPQVTYPDGIAQGAERVGAKSNGIKKLFTYSLMDVFSGEQGLLPTHVDERQATHVDQVEVRTQLPLSGREGEHQPAQLRHPGQLRCGQGDNITQPEPLNYLSQESQLGSL